jgi:hypothetical protein
MDGPAESVSARAGDPVFAYKPSLLGAVWEFRLAPDALEWQAGTRSGRTPYAAIRRMRLSFRPVTMQSYRFITDIWPQQGGALRICSTSWKSMLEQERLNRPYADFVGELHRRIAAANSGAVFERGLPAYQYWAGFTVFVVLSLGLAVLAVRGLQEAAWAGTAFVGGFLALGLWQLGGFFRRNRPGRYRADALPADLLPR